MMKRPYLLLLALLLGSGSLFPILAQQSNADAAAQIARAQTGGRVLSVRPSDDAGRPGYEVKVLLDDGRVRVLYINPD